MSLVVDPVGDISIGIIDGYYNLDSNNLIVEQL
jgi:hypothetical protein